MTERKEVMWCTLCGARFTDDEIKGCGCPKCGSQGVPCGTDGDVTVEVNWHELHVLCVWSENWARRCKVRGNDEMPAVVSAIARRLQAQHPQLGQLTLSSEIAMLPAELAKAGISVGPVETNVDRPVLLPVNGPGAVGHARPRQ